MLSDDQQQAYDEIMAFIHGSGSEYALSGPAGTGKSYLIAKLLDDIHDKTVHLTASTNKAARVVSEMGSEDAGTIHSLLGLRPQEDHNRGRLVLKKMGKAKAQKGSVIVIDESSMIQRELLLMIRDAADRVDAKILYVGDAYQLPPVFEKESPVFDLVERQSHLTTIHRQALESPIISVANGFREVLDGAEFPVVETVGSGVVVLDRDEFDERMLMQFNNGDDTRVLAWTNREVRRYNGMIRDDLFDYPEAPVTAGEEMIVNSAIERDGNVLFSTDEPIMLIEVEQGRRGDIRGYDVVAQGKGKTGISIFVPHHWHEAMDVVKEFSADAQVFEKEKRQIMQEGECYPDSHDRQRLAAWRDFFAVKKVFADIRPPYASTVHKSQGSTYESVYIDLDDIGKCTHWWNIARMVYVGMTRASDVVYVTGELPERLYEKVA